MSGLAWVNNISYYVHVLSVLGLLILLLLQINKHPRRVHPGAFHSAATALVAGLVMVGVRTPLHDQDDNKWELFNNTKIGIKFTILLVILYLILRNFKKPQVKDSVYFALVALTVTNILIAVLW